MSDKDPSPQHNKEIDAFVRQAYEQLLNEELPDRFQSLLEKLRIGEPLEQGAPSDISG